MLCRRCYVFSKTPVTLLISKSVIRFLFLLQVFLHVHSVKRHRNLHVHHNQVAENHNRKTAFEKSVKRI